MTTKSPLTIPRKIYKRGHVEFELLTARIRQYRYRLRYGRASPDPYNLIYVDTGDVNHLQTQEPQEKRDY